MCRLSVRYICGLIVRADIQNLELLLSKGFLLQERSERGYAYIYKWKEHDKHYGGRYIVAANNPDMNLEILTV